MNLYSHLVTASRVEARLHPGNLEAYYLGAIIPDIRYYCGLPRRQTHLPLERIAGFVAAYPHLESFALGYMVHCALDRLDLNKFLYRFPLHAIRKRLPSQFAPVLLEYYYLETSAVSQRISEAGNEMLDDLGIGREDAAAFARQLNRFLAAPSFEVGLQVGQDLGLLHNPGIESYLRVAQTIHRHWALRKLLFAGLNIAELDRQVAARVPALLAIRGVPVQ